MNHDDRMTDDRAQVEADDTNPDVDALADDSFDLELDGQVHTLPGALKGAFLRQADYTRKTQELAEHRRALEGERHAMAEHHGRAMGEAGDRATLAALESHLSEFEGVDWDALADADPRRAQVLWQNFQASHQMHERLTEALSHHDQRAQLDAARQAAEAMAETGRTLSKEIEGWSPEVAGKLVDYAQAFGVTLEELREAADPRLWKLLHKAYQADQAGEAGAREQVQAVRPAVSISGSGAGGGGVRDELATKEWMRRRNAQMAEDR